MSAARPTGEPLFPADAVLLPLASGKLLVSPANAIFCRIAPDHLASVEAVLHGHALPSTLPPPLLETLERHGFGHPPRAADAASPSVQIQLTNGCNVGCAYCCTNSSAPRHGEITRAEALGVLNQVRALLGPGALVSLLGGEPLLVPWAVDVAEHAVNLGLRLTLFTNALLLADNERAARVALLVRRGMGVRVSLASASRALCDEVSAAERFDLAIAGVCALARHGATATVDVMLLPSHVDDVAAHLSELRAPLPKETPIALGILYRSGREQGQHLFGSRAALEDALDRIAFEAGEAVPGTPRAPVTARREGCDCA